MLMLVLRAKVYAVLLAPEGVGILSQINMLDGMFSRFASIGIGYGITNLIAAQGEESEASRRNAEKTGLILALSAAFGLSLLVILLPDSFSRWLLGDIQYQLMLVLLAAAIPLRFLTAFHAAVLQGIKEIQRLSTARALGAVLGIIGSIFLTIWFGITGAVLGITFWALIAFITHYFQTRRAQAGNRQVGKFDLNFARIILKFGAANLAVILMTYLSVLIVRTRIIHQLGTDQNGIYQVVWAVSSQYLALVPLSLWSYGYPRITELLGDEIGFRRGLKEIWRLGILLLSPLIFMIVSNRVIVISLLYSSEFVPAGDLMIWQVWGDVLAFVLWWLELPLYARGQLRKLVLIEFVRHMGFLAGAVILLPWIGLYGTSAAYVFSLGLAMALTFMMLDTAADKTVFTMLVKVSILVLAGILLPQGSWLWAMISVLVVLCWFMWVLSSEEKEAAKAFTVDSIQSLKRFF